MKRVFDNSVSGGFVTSSGQISTGQMATKDPVYYNTNMVNIQREDHTDLHGIETQFNQTRVLPIVGKTSRAEIAIKSADVQTKCLPILQPQVFIDSNPATSDIDRLIYEVGLSATWRNSMLEIPKDNTTISSLAITGLVPYADAVPGQTVDVLPDNGFVYEAESTFQNIQSASIQLIDTYNQQETISLVPTPVTDTYLLTLFEYYRGLPIGGPPSSLLSTSLTPVVVGSVRSKILDVVIIPNTATKYAGSIALIVDSNEGYKIGDRLRLFGCSDGANFREPLQTPYTTVIGLLDYYTSGTTVITLVSPSARPAIIIDLSPSVSTVAVSTFAYSAGPPPSIITFTVLDNTMFTVGDLITIVGAADPQVNQTYTIDSLGGTTTITCLASFSPSPSPSPCSIQGSPTTFVNGYAINQTVKDGGHIEFLTDEHEFAPLRFFGSPNPYDGTLPLFYDVSSQPPLPVFESGFYRGYVGGSSINTVNFNATVELKIITFPAGSTQAQQNQLASTYNGYYQITQRSDSVVVFAPVSKALPITTTTDTTGIFFQCTLAPNFYTFDTRADEIIDPVVTFNKMNFMRNLGYIPSKDLAIERPTYPPTCSVPPQTWTRAYTVNWDFSAYRNLQWLTQDTTAPLPRLPLQFQDFGTDNGSSTYYNVYEINKFANDVVNKGVETVINDYTAEVAIFEAYSLDRQLAFAHTAFKQLFLFQASTFLYNPLVTYVLGQLAVSGTTSTSLAFMAAKSTSAPLPLIPESNSSWIYLGTVPYQIGDTTLFALCLTEFYVGANYFLMNAQVTSYQYDPNITNPIISISWSPIGTVTTPNATSLIPTPTFKTIGPSFRYNDLTYLMSVKYDGYGFGTINVIQPGITQQRIALYDYTRQSWGNQGANNADEWVTFESNTSFKFLFDNFPSYCTAYEDTLAILRNGIGFPLLSYWVWDSTSSHDPRKDGRYYEIPQTSESLSSCMSPVESIVVVSDNIPVLEELSSPAAYLIDSDSSAFYARTDAISLTNKIIGEIPLYHFSPYNVRSVIRYDANELHYYSLLDTKTFKQLEYSLYYRHRITQQLVPLILSNYGSVNIKFVFRPIS